MAQRFSIVQAGYQLAGQHCTPYDLRQPTHAVPRSTKNCLIPYSGDRTGSDGEIYSQANRCNLLFQVIKDGSDILSKDGCVAPKDLHRFQSNYAVIEKELFTIIQQFHDYILGKEIIIQTDPLAAILHNPLDNPMTYAAIH